MQSAGNDIIDLGTINQKRSRDRKFYSKILSVSEQSLYPRPEDTSLPWEQYVWLLWSIKESAYKYLKRGLPDLVFSPKKIIIQKIELPSVPEIKPFTEGQWEGNAGDEHCYKGNLIFENTILHCKSKIYSELIATVVSEDETFKDTWWGIQTITHTDTDHQSKSVRSFFLSKLNSMINGVNLRIEKNKSGYPFVTDSGKELNIPLSFAHHERYISYSFLLGSQ
jgi:phosphopantetheinyl transferase (holo-ACP synthase)